MATENFYAEALILAGLPGSEIISSDDIGAHAIELAHRGWQVFPLKGKIPAISRWRGGRGVLDATSDYTTVNDWWSGRYHDANIGIRLPAGLCVLDVDPRKQGHVHLAELVACHGALPATLKVWSGRGDGGCHFYLKHPGGRISSTRLGEGLDVKTHAGYVVAPPSLHPDTGQPYRWDPAPIVAPPRWLADLLRPEVKAPEPFRRPARPYSGPAGDSIADAYSANTTWRDVLDGWTLVSGNGDADGSSWQHPTATSPVSATVRNGCLFVYSPNTPFPVTETGDPHGLTKFRAYATLHHHGDLSAAARTLRTQAT